jgi:hypothetical protein
MIRHFQIACGDARTFQGKERDIIFLSMVVTAGNATALSRDTFAQRFNVAASRARDRMYLVRSIGSEDLSEADKLRRGLISHFASPFQREETRYDNLRLRCETTFERALMPCRAGLSRRAADVGRQHDIDLVSRPQRQPDGDRMRRRPHQDLRAARRHALQRVRAGRLAVLRCLRPPTSCTRIVIEDL